MPRIPSPPLHKNIFISQVQHAAWLLVENFNSRMNISQVMAPRVEPIQSKDFEYMESTLRVDESHWRRTITRMKIENEIMVSLF